MQNLEIRKLSKIQEDLIYKNAQQQKIPTNIIEIFIRNLNNTNNKLISYNAYQDWFNLYFDTYDLFVDGFKNELKYDIDYQLISGDQYLIQFSGLKQLELKVDKNIRQYYIQLEEILMQIIKNDQNIQKAIFDWCQQNKSNSIICNNGFNLNLSIQDQNQHYDISQIHDNRNLQEHGLPIGYIQLSNSHIKIPISYNTNEDNKSKQYQQTLEDQCLRYSKQKQMLKQKYKELSQANQ